jgi:hypothetical protein
MSIINDYSATREHKCVSVWPIASDMLSSIDARKTKKYLIYIVI